MNVEQITKALNAVSRANIAWRNAKKTYEAERASVLRRLLFEAAHNYMSVPEIARAAGMTPNRVRKVMRENGLDPRAGKRLLSTTAAKALRANAAALGIDPSDMDLASPLAYLPMGKELARSISGNVSKVTDLPEDRDALETRLYEVIIHRYEGMGEAWTTSESGDTLARAAAEEAVREIAGAHTK